MQAAVLKRLDDPDWAVRRQLAASLGELPTRCAKPPLVTMLERYGDDPVAVDAALSGLSAARSVRAAEAAAAPEETPQRSAAITMLAGTIVRSAQDAPVQDVLGADRPELDADVAALGAPSRRRGRAARRRVRTRSRPGRRGGTGGGDLPDVPGRRAGPGGGAAFPARGRAAVGAAAGGAAAGGRAAADEAAAGRCSA